MVEKIGFGRHITRDYEYQTETQSERCAVLALPAEEHNKNNEKQQYTCVAHCSDFNVNLL